MFIFSLSDTTLSWTAFFAFFKILKLFSQLLEPLQGSRGQRAHLSRESQQEMSYEQILLMERCDDPPNHPNNSEHMKRSRVCTPRRTGTNTCPFIGTHIGRQSAGMSLRSFSFSLAKNRINIAAFAVLQDHAGFTGYMQQNYGTTDTVLNTVSLGKWKTWGCTSAAVQRAWLHRNNTIELCFRWHNLRLQLTVEVCWTQVLKSGMSMPATLQALHNFI